MKLINYILSILLLVISLTVLGQSKHPYQSLGKKEKVLTLTKGKYEEFFDSDSIQQVGTVLMNVHTLKVVQLLSEEEAKERLQTEKQSRFLSVDPLTSSYPELTPYQYASNSPIRFIDLDGLEAAARLPDGSIFIPAGRDNLGFKYPQGASLIGISNGGNNFNVVRAYSNSLWNSTRSLFVRDRPPGSHGSEMEPEEGANIPKAIDQTVSDVKTLKNGTAEQQADVAGRWTIPALTTAAGVRGPKGNLLKTSTTTAVEGAGIPPVLKAKATEFIRTETIGGNKAARAVGANMKILNEGGSLAPIDVAKINNKLYVIDGHHRLEAALRTGQELKYNILSEDLLKSRGYNSLGEVTQAAAETRTIRLDNKIVNKEAGIK